MQLNEKDPLKIVYSWIGPRGPMVNTELPNIMSYASVGESTDAHGSSFFWADDIYWRVFMHNGNHPLSSTFGLEEHDPFIYPYTLAWRIEFQNYFLNGGGLLEFSHTPNHITHQVRDRNGFFLIDYAPEAWVQDGQLRAMHTYFGHYNRIPMGKIIYVTGCMNAEELYTNWCDRNGIPDDPLHRMIMIPFPISQHSLSMQLQNSPNEPEYDIGTVPEKVFLCWNRRFRPHRTHLALALDKAGIVDRSYYSMNLIDPEMNSIHFKTTVDLYSNPMLQIGNKDVENFMAKLPLVIDGETEIQKMCGDFDAAARPFYQNSLVSIITETNFDWTELTATEKTWKPAKEKHPFIMVGTAGALRTLREFGFQTFDEFWDESYDEIEDPKRRLYEIIKVCKDIASWSPEQILDFKCRVKPIVDHNFKILTTNTSKIVADKIRVEVSKRLRDAPED
jgi:hypothetical protein